MISKDEIKEIKAWCTSRKLKYTINDDGTVDIEGDVNIRRAKNGKFPVRFGKVTGNFYCTCNEGHKLTMLEGGPTYVSGDYICFGNELTSLQGAPTSVGGSFYCKKNKLTSLQGAPTSVGGSFYCKKNKLTSLQGAPTSVGGSFNCNANNLTSLQGGPSTVGGDYECYENELTSLQGAPTSVGGSFYCNDNKLTSLEGGPSTVGGSYYCGENLLITLKGSPKEIHSEFYCNYNQLTSLENGPTQVCSNYGCGNNNLTSLQGAPTSVGGSFKCNDNKLTSLQGGPSAVGGDYECYENELTSLQGAPTSVGGSFNCKKNKLTSLQGAPTSVGEDFSCSNNNLTSLQGAPTVVSRSFYCYGNNLTSLRGIENTTIGLDLNIDSTITDYDFAPIAVDEIRFANNQKLILFDKTNIGRGYYIVAPRVKTLGVMSKNSVANKGASKTIDLFHLPVRIDILGTTPPDIEQIEPSSISHIELHVPEGMVEVFAKHKQWKRSFLITDDHGTIVFANANNALKYEEHIAQIKKEEEEKQQRQVEKAKAEMLEQIQNSSHEALCRQLLAVYHPEICCFDDEFEVSVTLKCGKRLSFEVMNSSPFTVWQNLNSYLEQFDNLFLNSQPLGCEVELTMTLL